MRKFYLLTIVLLLSLSRPILSQEATETVTPSTEPAIIAEGENAVLNLYFQFLKQGRAGLLHLSGDDIATATGDIFLQSIEFYEVDGKPGLYALIAPELDQAIRPYTLSIIITYTDGQTETITTSFDVVSGNFIQQTVTLVEDIEDVLDEDIEQNELDIIFELAKTRTPRTLWDSSGFGAPVDGELTSPFGAVRTFNGEYNSRHTGWDFQAVIGEPMVASSSGTIAFAGTLPIRGNYILLDHGQGVFSGYAHLSVVYVTQGQNVQRGQIIGQVGSTGRSSSAHAHVEFIVNERWVDAADFIRMYLP